MKHARKLGEFLRQNGEYIPLEKQRDCITAYIYENEKLALIKKLDGVNHVKKVFNNIYRLKVDENRMEYIMQSLRSGVFNTVCHHAYKPLNTHHTRYYITDKITVCFTPEADHQYIEAQMEDLGLRYVRAYNASTYLLQVTTSTRQNPIKTANELAERAHVQYCEPNLISRFSKAFTPTDSRFPEQWHLKSETGPELVQDADISATQAWDITQGSRDIVIAVLDDGFDLSHPDLRGQNKIIFPRDFVDGGYDPSPGPLDFHGTPCAGIAIGEINGEGIVGVAPKCALMPVRIPFGADPDLLFEMLDYVGKRAHVISCSWGPPPVYAPLHRLVHDKIAELAESGGPDGKGCVIVFAAHNYNAPLKALNNQEGVKYLEGRKIYEHHDPIWNGNATHPDVIAVAACTSLNKKAAYSNWGKEIALCAPANNYYPLDYSIKLKGRGLTTSDNFRVGQHFSPNSRYTNLFGGTSGAAPIVAGVAGLVLSANPELTAKQVRQILTETADKIVDHDQDLILQHQKGTYDAQGHSEWFGHGKVNAFKAVQKAVAMRPEPEICIQTVNPIAPPVTTPPDPSPLVTHSPHTKPPLPPPAPIAEESSNELKLQALVQGVLKAEDDVQYFKVSIGHSLKIKMKDAPANTDFDLYLRKDSLPTKQDYDARGITETSDETIQFDRLETGDYYIMVSSFRGTGDFTLDISLE